jgi:hypothetical protein
MKRFALIPFVLLGACTPADTTREMLMAPSTLVPVPDHAKAAQGSVMVLFAADAPGSNDRDWVMLSGDIQVWAYQRGIIYRAVRDAKGPVDIDTEAGTVELQLDEATAFASRGIILAVPDKAVQYVSYSPSPKVLPLASEYFGVDP